MSIHGLPYLHTICFSVVSEGLFIQLTSPLLWGKARADFITNTGRGAMSTELAPLAILVTYGVGEGKLGMITTFCRSDQVKVEPSDSLSTLVQQDSPKPGVVVMKVFTNSHVGILWLPLPGHNHPFSGYFNHQIPTCPAVLTQVTPLFSHSVILP